MEEDEDLAQAETYAEYVPMKCKFQFVYGALIRRLNHSIER